MATLVTKEQYFDAALAVLADVGFKGLNIGVLCRKLGVTSGSFYNYFGNWEGFVRALLEYWENIQVETLKAVKFGADAPERDLASLGALSAGLNHGAEAAIRAWSMNDEIVFAALKGVDARRYKTTLKAIKGIVGDEDTAVGLTDFGTAMLLGYQQMVSNGRKIDRDRMFDDYVRFVLMHKVFGNRKV